MFESIKKNAILNIIYKLSSILFPLIVYPYVSRILLADNMGKVSFFNSLTNYAIMIGSLGIGTYGVRVTAKVRENNNQLSIIVKELLTLNTIVTLAVLTILILSIPFVNKFRENSLLFFISCIQVAIAPFSMEWLYNGLEQYGYITKRAIIFKVISIFLIFTFVRHQKDYIIYAAITVFGFVGNYVCNLVHSRQFINYKLKEHLQIKRHIKGTIILFSSILAINIYTNVDTLMLGFISGDRAVGLYDIAVKAKTVLLASINAISAVLFPRLSYYIAENNQELYNSVLKKSISIIFFIALPLTCFFFVEANDVVLVLGGRDYVDATLCMQILMPILLISGFSNITGQQILLPHGNDIGYMRAVITGACVDVVINAILMPKFSLYGAAIATLIAEVTQMTIQLLQSRRYLKSNVAFKNIYKCVFATAISSIVLLIVRSTFVKSAFVNLIVCSIFYASIYFIIILILKVDFVIESIKKLYFRIVK